LPVLIVIHLVNYQVIGSDVTVCLRSTLPANKHLVLQSRRCFIWRRRSGRRIKGSGESPNV